MSIRKSLVGAALAVALGTTGAAQANNILFDPDGAGATFAAKEITAFDWFPGSALALNGNLSAETSGTFSSIALVQSLLSTATKAGQLIPVFSSTDLVPLDITFVVSLPETVTVNGVNDVDLALDAAGTPNFFRIYVGGNAADFLAGTGFNGAGGATLILSGTITASTGSFTVNDDDGDGSAIEQFDQAGANDWPGVNTIEGNGSTTLQVNVTSFLAAYFPGGIQTLSLNFNTSLVDPFREVDPSRQFWDGTNLVNANLGTLNGGPSATCDGDGDCDFEFQADANNSFNATSVPEPGSLALLGLGLFGLAFGKRVARKQRQV